MLKSLSEIAALPEDELLSMLSERREPVLITHNGEPRFVAQTVEQYETLIRKLRQLEAKTKPHSPAKPLAKILPFRR